MNSSARIVLVALAAGTLGVIASLLVTGPGLLLRTDTGQRALSWMLARKSPRPPPGVPVARLGAVVPALALRDLDGDPIALPGAYAGRPLLLNVWASWCGPCAREVPALQRYAAQQGANGVQVVGIALDDPAAVRAFLRRVEVTYPIAIDAPGPRDAGVRLGDPSGVLPYSVLIGPDGRLRKQRIGPFADREIDSWAGK